MLKNNGKITIGKYFLVSIFVICLVFISFGANLESSYAADVNASDDEICLEVDAQDKLENSQLENNVLEVNSDENEVLEATHKLNGGSFKTIQDAINDANSGDVIQLSGTFKVSDRVKRIDLNKKLTITSTSGAVLEGSNESCILFLNKGAKGSTISNLKFIKGGTPDRGGAIRLWADDTTISSCVFENNFARNGGGAISSQYNASSALNAVIKDCVFKNNGANVGGGAVTLYGNNSKVIDCVFDSNYATNDVGVTVYGGAIQLSLDTVRSTASVIGCNFTNNWARSNSQNPSHGGAGCIRDGVSYTDCIFIGNSAGEGGALTFHASGSITNCIFKDNKATEFGGAISTGFLYNSMDLNILNCQFDNNSAPIGGAIQLVGENIVLEKSNFTDNFANQIGGAVNIEAETVVLRDDYFKNNTVWVDGGAIFVKGQSITIKDSTFDSNEAKPSYDKLDDGLGGAIYVNGTHADISGNVFKFNTARNGSAVYNDEHSVNLVLADNVMFENQAWVYALPISAKDIYFADSENISVVIHGGNNIARYGNLAVSNAIYNNARSEYLKVDGYNPVDGATDTGVLYQDDREYNIDVLLTVEHEDGTLVYNNTLKSSYLGEISTVLNDLKPGKYYVTAKHFEDTYYKAITNYTTFTVYPKVDNQIEISSDRTVYDFDDVVVWTINITNNGPNNSTGVIAKEILPEGLIYVSDTSNGLYDSKTGVINISTLDAGEKISFNVLTVINKTGKISNDVNITAKEFDTDLENNLDSHAITVSPACDIQVTKSVNNSSPNYNDLVRWTISVRNNGPDAAHNVVVCDILPNSLIPVNGSSRKITWKIESLEAGGEMIFYLTTYVNGTGAIENVANATAQEFDYDLSNNEDSEIIRVSPSSDLSISKSVNSTIVNCQDTVRWTLTVKNNGPNDATGVKITDELPEGFVYISSTIDFTGDTIDIGNLAAGDTVSVDIICRADTSGKYTNLATVSGNEYDPNPSNNQDNESVTVNPAVDLEISKSVDDDKPKNGQIITWTITVKNNGPDTAHDVKVYEMLPDSMIWIEDDSLGDYNPQTGILSIDVLDVGEEFELNIVCRVNATGVITNDVNVSSSEHDTNMSNNRANGTVEVQPSADVSIIKLVNDTAPNYNDLVKWTLIASNNGPDKATVVEVSEILPDALILVNSTPSKGIYDNGLWFLCCLEKGEVQTLEIVCRVNKTGSITNAVEISADENDPNSTNNEDNETIEVASAADIEVIQKLNTTSPSFGETVIWMVTVKNNGPDNATGVELSDILPDGLIFKDYTSTKGEYVDGTWTVGDLEVGGSEYLNITCVVNGLNITANNTVVKSHEYDWNESNNQYDIQIDVVSLADISIEKLVDNSNPNYGDMITWTLVIKNNGPNDASNIIVCDSISEKLEFVKSSDDENYDGEKWHVESLKTGETKQLTIQCRVIATGSILNTANVSADESDPNLENNYAQKSVSVSPASDLSVTKIASKYKYIAGEVISYEIEVINNGPDTAFNVRVNEILDDFLKVESFKVSRGTFNKATNVWTISQLAYGESARLYIKVIAEGIGIFRNDVEVTSDSFDYDMSNNKDFAIVDVVKASEVVNASKAVNASKIVKKTSKSVFNEPKDTNINMHKNEFADTELHQTSNPFLMLLVSCVVSIIFLGENIFKRR